MSEDASPIDEGSPNLDNDWSAAVRSGDAADQAAIPARCATGTDSRSPLGLEVMHQAQEWLLSFPPDRRLTILYHLSRMAEGTDPAAMTVDPLKAARAWHAIGKVEQAGHDLSQQCETVPQYKQKQPAFQALVARSMQLEMATVDLLDEIGANSLHDIMPPQHIVEAYTAKLQGNAGHGGQSKAT